MFGHDQCIERRLQCLFRLINVPLVNQRRHGRNRRRILAKRSQEEGELGAADNIVRIYGFQTRYEYVGYPSKEKTVLWESQHNTGTARPAGRAVGCRMQLLGALSLCRFHIDGFGLGVFR